MLRRALLSAALIATAGCASLARQAFQTPTVELKQVRVRAIGLDGGSLDFELDIFNPNDYRIDATRFTYTLTADSNQVATGAVNQRVTLVNRAHNPVTMPVSFDIKQLMGAAQTFLKKGSVDYVVNGEVTVSTPFGSVTRPYVTKATFDNGQLIPRP